MLKTSLSVSPLQFGSRFFLCLGGKSCVTWSGHVLFCGDMY